MINKRQEERNRIDKALRKFEKQQEPERKRREKEAEKREARALERELGGLFGGRKRKRKTR